MMRVNTERGSLAVRESGSGEPILFIHGALYRRLLDSFVEQSGLDQEFKTITFDRHGFADSSTASDSYSVEDTAADALDVIARCAGGEAHVVAHSVGGAFAMQLALDAPNAVKTLTLLEPVVMTEEYAEFAQQELIPAGSAYFEGDKRSAVDQFSRAVLGEIDYPGLLDRTLSVEWFERAVEDADTAFGIDLPAFGEWTFGPDQISQIRTPVLLVLGERTVPVHKSIHAQMLTWLPNASEARVPEASHFMSLSHAEETADAIRTFIRAHGRPR
jgi:pimeloyl-ACP methyl ester carboxylesterase